MTQTGIQKCPAELIVIISAYLDDIRPIVNLSSTNQHFHRMLADKSLKKLIAKKIMGPKRLKDLIYDGCWSSKTTEFEKAVRYAKHMSRMDEPENRMIIPVIEDSNERHKHLVEPLVRINEIPAKFGKPIIAADTLGVERTRSFFQQGEGHLHRNTGIFRGAGMLTGELCYDVYLDIDKRKVKYDMYPIRSKTQSQIVERTTEGIQVKLPLHKGLPLTTRAIFEATDPKDNKRVVAAYPMNGHEDKEDQDLPGDRVVVVLDSAGQKMEQFSLPNPHGIYKLITQFSTAGRVLGLYFTETEGELPWILNIYDLQGKPIERGFHVPRLLERTKCFTTNNHFWVIDENNDLYSLSVDQMEPGDSMMPWRLQAIGRCCYNLQPSNPRFYGELISLVSRGVLVTLNYVTSEVHYYSIPELRDSIEGGGYVTPNSKDEGGGIWFVDDKNNVVFIHRVYLLRRLLSKYEKANSAAAKARISTWQDLGSENHSVTPYGLGAGVQFARDPSIYFPLLTPIMSPYQNEFKSLHCLQRYNFVTANQREIASALNSREGSERRLMKILCIRTLKDMYWLLMLTMVRVSSLDTLQLYLHAKWDRYFFKAMKMWEQALLQEGLDHHITEGCACESIFHEYLPYMFRCMHEETKEDYETIHRRIHMRQGLPPPGKYY